VPDPPKNLHVRIRLHRTGCIGLAIRCSIRFAGDISIRMLRYYVNWAASGDGSNPAGGRDIPPVAPSVFYRHLLLLRRFFAPHTKNGETMATMMKSGKKPTSKSEMIAHIVSKTNLKRKEVVAVLDELSALIERDLKTGPGIVNLYGLMKVKVVRKPAVPARRGINPFTKEEVMFKAKPARNVVKIQPLKTLKEMV